MATIHVDIVSPEGQLYAGEANMVFAPAVEGELGIAPRHAPLLTTLSPGTVRVQVQGEDEHTFWIGGGALEIQPHNVSILADTAARAHDLDEAAAQEAKRQAEQALSSSRERVDIAAAQAELARAVAQLRAIAHLRKKR
jgi:F-type H+-transporting ATPase subunit epsilon